jgi:Ca-activated chloride channel homolog
MSSVGLVTSEGTRVPLLGVDVSGEVAGDRAQVKVRQRYRNDEKKPIEAIYVFPLPSDATLCGFAMTCQGRRIDGVVKEREEAFRAYDDALAAGHGAALVDQERANVFTASVGNLLPGEETLIEVTYVQRLTADEGALRWMIPTLVAPRYIPGKPTGSRTAHGAADPTDVVPDADRITPAIGDARYGLSLDLLFDLGRKVTVESPSHAIQATDEAGGRVRVKLAKPDVALDRDLVITARGAGDGPLTSVTIDRGAPGDEATLALAVVPDLAAGSAAPRQDVVFLIDVSGSMAGASLNEAQAALRLCLRHLREGDRFNVIAFQSSHHGFAPGLVPFTQKTLEQADAWVRALVADGGTEILPPLLDAAKQAQGGVIVLLTDGQVGNEDQVLAEVMAARGAARIYSFGIGTAVSDVLLRQLGVRTGGGVELIHPGERIDEKVVAQFARATAARVTDVTLSFSGIEAGELAPAELPALVDGEPWAVYARVPAGRLKSGRAEIRGKLGAEPFFLPVAIDAEAAGDRPFLVKLWAAERVRDLEGIEVTGRHAGRMKERIVALAVKHGIASRYTSFVVVEERAGDRRASGFPETRVVPVNAPAGWAMFQKQAPARAMMHRTMAGIAPPAGMPTPMVAQAPAPMSAGPARGVGGFGIMDKAAELGRAALDAFRAGLPAPPKAKKSGRRPEAKAEAEEAAPSPSVLERQLASGLWQDGGGSDDVARVRATARALRELLDAGTTTGHALHGAQLKKAVAALLALAPSLVARDRAVAELALAIAWLVSSGHRTRKDVEKAAGAAGVTLPFGDEKALRALVDERLR